MKQPLFLKSNFKTHQKWQATLSIWMFRTLIWWFVALMVPKVGFDMIWFAIVPSGISLLFWPVGLSVQNAGILRWIGLSLLSFIVFLGQNHLMDHEMHQGFIVAGSFLTAVLVGTLTSYFSS
jgi:hypothetical protein